MVTIRVVTTVTAFSSNQWVNTHLTKLPHTSYRQKHVLTMMTGVFISMTTYVVKTQYKIHSWAFFAFPGPQVSPTFFFIKMITTYFCLATTLQVPMFVKWSYWHMMYPVYRTDTITRRCILPLIYGYLMEKMGLEWFIPCLRLCGRLTLADQIPVTT